MTDAPFDPAIADARDSMIAQAPFLRRLALSRPEVLDRAAGGDFAGAIADAHEAGEGATDVARALRRERQAVSLVVALGDISGRLAFEQVVRLLSDFADRAVERALQAIFRERGADDATGFCVLALGKHGSRELNYSSDIDPILLFDPDTLPRRRGEEPVEAAARIARRLVEMLQARDANGYVFRVDLRLRPSPEATPPALPVEAAIGYYESSALPWERAAFIRARAAAGDAVLGQGFLAAIRPFVWRRGLGFGTVGEIREISSRIRDHYSGGQLFGPGYDLKRGRGGIREVEFFTQIQQLVHGGRDVGLRAPATLDALAALAGAGHIAGQEADRLAVAYRLFRTIEHRLQMIEDHQTHSLPRDPAALDAVARLDGMADGAALLDRLRPHVAAVGRIYDSLDPVADDDLPRDPSAVERAVTAAGFRDAAAVRGRIEGWRAGTPRALRTPAAQAAMEAALPGLTAALGLASDPDAAFARLDRMVSGLPTAIDFFRLVAARPALGRLVADILATAPALADQLGRRPALLDALIDASAFDPPPSAEVLAQEFGRAEPGGDYQMLLDRARTRINERRFALGTQIVAAAADPIDVAAGYARVAEGAIAALAGATVAEFAKVHGVVPGGELLILALGRLGGGALTHASDLDLIYLFSGDHLAESNGQKPIGATTYFNRLAQRVTAALSVATPAGPLYDVDTRLRPSGAQGLLAVSIDSFERYQRENAWTWEHMALTRARPVFGSPEPVAALSATIRAVLAGPRDAAVLVADAVRMRGEIRTHKPPAGPFDVKLVPGGLVDAEFAVHVLQLRHAIGLDTRLRSAIAALADAGLIDGGMAAAHALLTRMLVVLRLVSPASTEPPPAVRPMIAAACGVADWAALIEARDDAQRLIAAEWARISGV
ncbi:bifunctional [glutamine synthetase] adenylyltransferase/[glutamine synthetase]-adenylyl-L-tyrosine phosphorylase [Sphingomonas montana]|uniref:bifunctional [glutamine synthetase] adenylyltransferase/[glutamine synthetase]-adenylyl-L-tyrosine phosphorylase n=1 Tax=Sphingomonas montana TaxID=1843236 RepID=UPI0023E3F380|nr:bifunctional [glutamine synthetase] adenylyltransferase/[glutamine synthetase]-adenylyl-L-tyrosine phosphorylase [Sphingomonas montana]